MPTLRLKAPHLHTSQLATFTITGTIISATTFVTIACTRSRQYAILFHNKLNLSDFVRETEIVQKGFKKIEKILGILIKCLIYYVGIPHIYYQFPL